MTELAARGPERPALTCAGRTLTFGELDARSSQVAHALVRDGVRPGDRVAVLTKNRPEYFELLFGAVRARAVLVGLNWRLSAPEIAAIADDAEPAAVFAGKAQLELLPESLRDHAVDLDAGYEAWIAGLPTHAAGHHSRRRRRRPAALQLRHHRPAQRCPAHQRQPALHAPDGPRGLPDGPGQREPAGLAAVPHRRHRATASPRSARAATPC